MDNFQQLEEIKNNILLNKSVLLRENGELVFGKGNSNADILFIGEAPGEKESIQGIPFVGRAGQELDKQLQTIGLTLDDVYIANILKYRPPKNRDPTIEEITNHTPYLIQQIQVIKPKIILTLGNYATKFVLAGFQVEGMKKIQGVSLLHGKPVHIDIQGVSYQVIPLYHPAAMMYNPKLRPLFTQDFLHIKKILGK